MNDKEVGELWRWVQSRVPDDADVAMDTQAKIENLICKLVEERAQYIKQVLETSQDCEFFIPDALRAFGIDPQEWKESTPDEADKEELRGQG